MDTMEVKHYFSDGVDDAGGTGGGAGDAGAGGDAGTGGGSVQDPATGKFIPIERFNEVYGKNKEYERQLGQYSGYGKPDELKAKLDKLAAWEKAVEEQRKAASMTDTEKAAEQRKLQLRKELVSLFPELDSIKKIEELEKVIASLQGSSEESKASQVLEKHSLAFTGVLKAAKIDLKYQDKIEEYIVSQMDDEQKKAFIAGDFSIAQAIFDNELKDGLFSAMRAKPVLPVPPIRNTAGGTGPKGGKPKPMTMREAEEAGWARLQGGEE